MLLLFEFRVADVDFAVFAPVFGLRREKLADRRGRSKGEADYGFPVF